MSMYSDLLAMSLALEDNATNDPPDERRLLDQLTVHRDPHEEHRSAVSVSYPDVSTRIAVELEYDSTLIKLCRLHAIPYDVSSFTRPLEERSRLEEALEAVGVKVRPARRGVDGVVRSAREEHRARS